MAFALSSLIIALQIGVSLFANEEERLEVVAQLTADLTRDYSNGVLSTADNLVVAPHLKDAEVQRLLFSMFAASGRLEAIDRIDCKLQNVTANHKAPHMQYACVAFAEARCGDFKVTATFRPRGEIYRLERLSPRVPLSRLKAPCGAP